jgi:hypothetical protein
MQPVDRSLCRAPGRRGASPTPPAADSVCAPRPSPAPYPWSARGRAPPAPRAEKIATRGATSSDQRHEPAPVNGALEPGPVPETAGTYTRTRERASAASEAEGGGRPPGPSRDGLPETPWARGDHPCPLRSPERAMTRWAATMPGAGRVAPGRAGACNRCGADTRPCASETATAPIELSGDLIAPRRGVSTVRPTRRRRARRAGPLPGVAQRTGRLGSGGTGPPPAT